MPNPATNASGMGCQYDYVCPAENTPYMEWQAMAFHHSVLKATGRPPIIMVMEYPREPLLDGFKLIRQSGRNIQRCPNYRNQGYTEYAPRNTPGCLLHGETNADFVILCDADMLFTHEPFVPRVRENEITLDNMFQHFMHLDHPKMRAYLKYVVPRVGLDRDRFSRWPTWGGVPHVIPRSMLRTLAHEWLACCDFAMATGPDSWQPNLWESSMWALVWAIVRLHLEPVRTYWCEHNNDGKRPWDPWWAIIHYVKHDGGGFIKNGRECFPADDVKVDRGSIDAQILKRLRAAEDWWAERCDRASESTWASSRLKT